MNKNLPFEINDSWVLSKRGKKNNVDPTKPYAYFVEKERTTSGLIEDTATIFLTNSECPFSCLMCDLWKNTTAKPVPVGTIPSQIEWALNQLPDAKHLKLYNNGNFFDKNAVPEQDYKKIADIVKNFKTVIIENHPGFINKKCINFKKLLKPELQIALGLETAHPEILLNLNKRMDLSGFEQAVKFLNKNGISTRAFILLQLPFLNKSESIIWAKKSLEYAFSIGIECCVIIPTRPGNGAMEDLIKHEQFSLPDVKSLENVIEYGIKLKKGRVFADVWNIELFSNCRKCIDERKKRIVEMNLHQQIFEPVKCTCSYC